MENKENEIAEENQDEDDDCLDMDDSPDEDEG